MKYWSLILILLLVLSGCDFIFDEEVNEAAKEAIKTKNPAACKQIEDESASKEKSRQERCYRKVAEGLKEWTICNNIKTTSTRDYCLMDVAEKLENEEICKHISSEANNLDNCYYKVAVAAKNEHICENMEGTTKKEDCIVTIAIKKQQASVCSSPYVSPQKEKSCIIQIAEERDDWRICFDGTGYHSSECVAKIGYNRQDKGICNEAYSEDDDIARDNCYIYLAAGFNDPNICHEIVNKDMNKYEDCLLFIADAHGNSAVCEELEGEYRERCFDLAK